jgi:lipopolysaccharide/colanic/teichoic acid biosynthesis glycosyltransferase
LAHGNSLPYAAFKRALDIVVSGTGLLLFLPIGIVIAAAIWITDRGPVFYGQERVGREGRKFKLLKFRSMRATAPGSGPAITHGARDPRITRIGYYLRLAKLDEFPQLWNVLMGEMSVVGPRPEVEKYVRLYSADQLRVLHLKPGITDITVVRGHLHDTSLLDGKEDPESYYVNVLMPLKLQHNLEYLERQSGLLDLQILAATVLLLLGIKKNRAIQPDPHPREPR